MPTQPMPTPQPPPDRASRSPLNRRDVLAFLSAPVLLMIGQSLCAQQSAPALQSYDVELIIFRTLSGNATNEEWASSVTGSNATSGEADTAADTQAEAAPLTAPTATFPPLPDSKLKLTAIADTLRRSRRYQPLAHFGWTQPGFPRNEARFIPIDSVMGSATPGLSGRVALARGRYLHLTLDLSLSGEDGTRYLLQQTRRMRSNERHYIDHPKFGVIALITPTQGSSDAAER